MDNETFAHNLQKQNVLYQWRRWRMASSIPRQMQLNFELVPLWIFPANLDLDWRVRSQLYAGTAGHGPNQDWQKCEREFP